MTTTRHAENDKPFRQERFASSPEYELGLMANLVAMRCTVLTDASARDLVWFLQHLSHIEGGLDKVASDLVAMFPERLATRSMRAFGMDAGKVYNAEQVKKVRAELNSEYQNTVPHPFFPLAGETQNLDRIGDFDLRIVLEELQKEAAEKSPDSYPASVFVEHCLSKAQGLTDYLRKGCLNPGTEFPAVAPSYFPDLFQSLLEFKSAWVEARRAGVVVTEIGRQVYETLDYCLENSCAVLIDGHARTGKTFSVRAWCDQHPSEARYVQVPSTNDDIGFFRAIAAGIGVSINQNSKAHELRTRIEDTLQKSRLMLVLDEGHYLWPQGNFREKMPGRISWLMTALINYRVPVAIVTTPQFMRTQKTMERNSTWTSEQFTGRIGHYQKLPDSLALEDLAAVARAFLPGGCDKCIKALVCYAQASAKYLAAIESVATRATYIARKAGRTKALFPDVMRAIDGSVIPSDSALNVALSDPGRARRGRAPAPPSLPDAPSHCAPSAGKERSEIPSSRQIQPLAPGEIKRGAMPVASVD